MYALVLIIHNLFRWIVLLVAVYTLFRIYTGWLGRRAWTRVEGEAATLYGMAVDIQLLLGLVLVFLSWPFLDTYQQKNVLKRPILRGVFIFLIAVWIVLLFWGRI